MKLTVDIELSATTFAEEKNNAQAAELQALAHLLSRAHRSMVAQPLEVKVCEDFNLSATPDYPIAPLCAQAENFDIGNAYWFRAAPVHLALQRDAFSLYEEVPLNVKVEHAQSLLETLNRHFNEEGLQFLLGASGAWYVKVTHSFEKFLPVKTHFPQMAIGKNIHQWMPEGQAAQKWRSILNELQMVLFEHAVNQARESSGEIAINSVWFSGGGFMPRASSKPIEDFLVLSNNPFYAGLAQHLQLQSSILPDSFSASMHRNADNIRINLPIERSKNLITTLIEELKRKKITALTLNVGFYEQTLVAIIKPRDLYKFWIKTKALSHFFMSR